MPKKDKKRVLDEVWTPQRVRSFLDILPPEGVDADFNRLLRAYRSMKIEDFQLFLEFFGEAGGDLNARGPDGVTVLSIVSAHRRSVAYAEALKAAGAAD